MGSARRYSGWGQVSREKLLTFRLEHEIVHENPHVDAAVGGTQEVIHRDQADVIPCKDEVLRVDRMLGGLGEPGARDH